jgi:protein-tyrosine phosphatase
MLFRTGLLGGVDRLAEAGIRMVLDLRMDDERGEERGHGPHRASAPDAAASVAVRRMPFSGLTPAFAALERPTWRDYADHYVRLLPRAHAPVRSLFATLGAGRDQPVAIGCSLGKDRTGIVVAVLLATLGAADDVIAEDYAKTGASLHDDPLLHDYARRLGVSRAELARRCRTRQETVHAFLTGLRATYGSVAGYLVSAGVSGDLVERVQEQLLGGRDDHEGTLRPAAREAAP